MSRRDFLRTACSTTITASIGGLAMARPNPARAAGPALQRPISDFVNVQGTTMQFVPPVGDFIGWTSDFSRPPVLGASVDYAGVAARYLLTQGIDLGTTTSGSITERLLADGRAQVSVTLHTTNALTWVIPFDPNSTANQFGENPLLFGYRAPEVAMGARPALADSNLNLVLTHKVFGGPLPDLSRDLFINPDPDLALISVDFHASADGPLRALSGLGPEGTPGRCTVSETGVLSRAHFKGATADGFPSERIDLRVIGKR